MSNIGLPIHYLLARNCSLYFRHYHTSSKTIVIASAARTPWRKYHDHVASLSALQLGQTIVEAVVKRSAIPIEQIHWILMNETQKLQQEFENKSIYQNFLKNTKYMPFTLDADISDVASFMTALELVKSQPKAAVVTGGVAFADKNVETDHISRDHVNETSTEYIDYMKKNLAIYNKSVSETVFEAEIVPLKILKHQGKSRVMEEVYQDEIFTRNTLQGQHFDGSVAVVLTNLANAQELKLSPLAVIEDFEYLYNTEDTLPRSLECLEKLFLKVKLQPSLIKHWEINDLSPVSIDCLQQRFNLQADVINPYGCSLISSHSSSTNFLRLLTHIAHDLRPLEYGCVVSNSYQYSYALILQKLSALPASRHLPLITLYTTNDCPLCDILIEELEYSFSGEYELIKVFIDNKENLRFLRLYRYDIPVVFLNNQFLCMHRLNHNLLRKQLNLLKINNL